LTQNLTEKRWREVVLLTVGMVYPADELLRQLKQATDELLAKDISLQGFLSWVWEKSQSIHAFYKPAAIRAFYFAFVLARDRDRALNLDLARVLDLDLDLDLNLTHDLALDLALDRDLDRALDHDLVALDRALALALDHDLVALDRARLLAAKSNREQEHILMAQLENLFAQLPKNNQSRDEQVRWWWQKWQAWAAHLRVVMIEHRNMGHHWQFTEVQKRQLKQYYEANKLLVACLNSDCYVSRGVREEIEETLLLPIAEIKKRNL